MESFATHVTRVFFSTAVSPKVCFESGGTVETLVAHITFMRSLCRVDDLVAT